VSEAARRALRSLPAHGDRPSPPHLRSLRLRLADGAWTTLHVATYRPATAVRVVRVPAPTPLQAWCAGRGVAEAVVGGFFVRATGVPLGELRTRGIVRRTVPFAAPWGERRACVHAAGGVVTIARRPELPAEPRGCSTRNCSDITAGRYPRAALGIGRCGRLLAVAADGRGADDAGLTLAELAEALVALGATRAINLDGGGSASLVCGGALRNRPREGDGTPIPGGRPVTTALLFTRR